jgi:hypothetical protein
MSERAERAAAGRRDSGGRGSFRAALGIALLWLAAAAPAALACATCYGDPDAAVTKGMNGAILLLLGVVGLVYAGIVRVFLEFRRRARRLAERERRFRLIHGGAR